MLGKKYDQNIINIIITIIIMHALYFSSSAVFGNAMNVVIGCQGSQSEFSSLVSDWMELWHIVTLGCVEQASHRHFESTKDEQASETLHAQKRSSAHIQKLILNAKFILVRSKYFLLCETNIFSTKLRLRTCKMHFCALKILSFARRIVAEI